MMLERLSSPVNPAAMLATSSLLRRWSARPACAGDADELAAEHLLDHRRRHAQHADAGADVQAEHAPQQPRTAAASRPVHVHVARASPSSVACGAWARPAGGLPVRARDAVAERARHHRDEVDDARAPRRSATRRPTSGVAKWRMSRSRQRRADHRAAAEAHDGHAGREPAPVGEPLDERRDRARCSRARARTRRSRRARASMQPDLVRARADRRDDEAAAPAAGRRDAGLARPDALQPARRTPPPTSPGRRWRWRTSRRRC